MNWQPIETAPKDGTPILGYGVDGELMAVVYWYRWGGGWRLMVSGDFAEDDEWFPDQWAPISPPKAPDAK